MILNCLSTTTHTKTGEDWDRRLYEVQWAINSSQHKVTRRTPYKIIFNYKIVGFNDSPLTREIGDLNLEMGTTEEGANVTELLHRNKKTLSDQFNKKRIVAKQYEVGDLVMQRCGAPATSESRKLSPKFRGPYEIETVLGNDRYAIRDIKGEKQSQRTYQGVVAADRLKYVASAKDNQNRVTTRSKSSVSVNSLKK